MPATPGCKGLSPKENREVPPLRYEMVYRLKRDFPQLTIVLNGGVTTDAQIAEHLAHVDGVMLGREAYHDPWVMADWDARFFGAAPHGAAPRRASRRRWSTYMERVVARRRALVARDAPHAGPVERPAGRARWRQVWSDHRLKAAAGGSGAAGDAGAGGMPLRRRRAAALARCACRPGGQHHAGQRQREGHRLQPR